MWSCVGVGISSALKNIFSDFRPFACKIYLWLLTLNFLTVRWKVFCKERIFTTRCNKCCKCIPLARPLVKQYFSSRFTHFKIKSFVPYIIQRLISFKPNFTPHFCLCIRCSIHNHFHAKKDCVKGQWFQKNWNTHEYIRKIKYVGTFLKACNCVLQSLFLFVCLYKGMHFIFT